MDNSNQLRRKRAKQASGEDSMGRRVHQIILHPQLTENIQTKVIPKRKQMNIQKEEDPTINSWPTDTRKKNPENIGSGFCGPWEWKSGVDWHLFNLWDQHVIISGLGSFCWSDRFYGILSINDWATQKPKRARTLSENIRSVLIGGLEVSCESWEKRDEVEPA